DDVSVLLGGTGASLGPATHYPVGGAPHAVLVGDFNADGDPDLATSNLFSDDVSVLLGGAGGTFGAASHFAAGKEARSGAVGDFNADGDLDLAVVNRGVDTVTVLLNTSVPAVALSSASVGFGSQLLGTPGPIRTVSLTNTGESVLHVSSALPVGSDPADFLTSGSCVGAALAPKASCTLGLAFRPSAPGARSARLEITDDAPGVAEVALSGVGISRPGACANPRQGTALADTLLGTPAGDRLSGLGGADRLNGLAGADCLSGGSGKDRLAGGSGKDRLAGDRGNDVASGGQGNDRLTGGGGKDRLNGDSGNDILAGGSGNDRLTGGKGRNRYSAGSGRDAVNARNRRRERVDCGPGRDRARVDRSDRVRRCERVTRR
ncbi:MAG: choice-of-anchor D domain-containing protein, partial [Actinomycetota bacterium]|nr:choice-of-anchor D domain-containing protein [Actinomycetota bacterium]